MNTTPIIQLNNVSKHYSLTNEAGVSDIDISISKGDFVAIVGESGSGKSTLLKLIYGLLAPNAGEILFKGEHLKGPHERLIPGHESMKMVTQDFNLNLYARVYDNISGMLSNEDVHGKEQKTWEMMEFLGIDKLAEKRIVELSGGEQQRVAIARAIVTEPEVLLLDEPFSQIDAVLKTQLRADLRRLCSFLGITMILVSHDPTDGMTLADDMIIIKDGRIKERGRPSDIYSRPSHTYTASLLGNAFVLPSDEARSLGLKPSKGKVMIYPEWVQLKSTWSSRRYQVKDVFFKGFYEELLLEREHIKIRALNMQPGSVKKGETVQVLVSNFLEFD
ncbi:ABC transporter ATP-binding protein [Flavihumibacter sp. R14]|nr:ABC transporter ATP-binding protein [Flavihumibacter soli]